MRSSSITRSLRQFVPVIFGLFIGMSISVFKSPLTYNDCIHLKKDHFGQQFRPEKTLYSEKDVAQLGYTPMEPDEAERYRKDRKFAPVIKDSIDDFEPRIITDPELRPKVSNDYDKNQKKVHRPNLLKTELGIRERLACAVLSSQQTLPTMGVAMNRTFSHHMQKVSFFAAMNDLQPNDLEISNMDVKTVATSDKTLLLFEMLLKMFMKNGEKYDWFFITTDHTYSEAHRINELIDHISINRRLYMGKPVETRDRNNNPFTYCNLNSGILISRLLFVDFYPHLKTCRHDTDFDLVPADQWLGKCIQRATRGAVNCVDNEDGAHYHSFDLASSPSFDIESETAADFKDAVTVSGVTSSKQMYQLHKRFSEIEVDRAYEEILDIQKEIKSLEPKLPANSPKLSWPIGVNPPFKPTSRWDIISWDYFTEDYTLTCPGEIPRCELNGIDKIDVQNIIQIALKRLNDKYNPQGLIIEKKNLINGYRRYDPQRGMEYVLDVLLKVVTDDGNEVEVNHRVDLLRPLTQPEIVPMPFVTEAVHVNVITAVVKEQRHLFKAFMQNYDKEVLSTGEKVTMTIVFIYDAENAAKLRQSDIFAEEKKILTSYEAKYKKVGAEKLVPWISIKTELPSQLKIMDIESKKKYRFDDLLLVTNPSSNLNVDFLNRCRMNTIKGWQAFFPIPFSQYNPEILYKNTVKPDHIDIKANAGHFDIYSFDEVCMYQEDYHNARELLAASIVAKDTKQTTNEASDTMDVYDLLIKYSQLHVFRAVEPHLLRRYSHRTCDQRSGDEIYNRCIRSNAEGLASRSQLAMDLFPEE